MIYPNLFIATLTTEIGNLPMSYTNAQIVSLALVGRSGKTTTGNMSTDHYRPGFTRYGAPYHGSLPRVWRSHLDSRFSAGKISQVIYSYSTPIAWHDTELGWIVPVERYSITTSSKHQTHLYRLHGRYVAIPYDATSEDLQRVLDGLMVFTTNNRGEYVGIKAGSRAA